MKEKKSKLTRKKVPINNVTLVTNNPDDKVTEVTHKKNIFDFIKRKNKIKFSNKELRNLKKKPESTYIIEMLFSNGTCKSFVLETTEPTFKLSNDDKRLYYMFYEECYYDITLKQNRFIYSEEHCTPINREIQTIKDEDGEESPYFYVNPENMKDFIEMRYIKAITENPDGFDYIGFIKKNWLFIVIGIGILIYYLNGQK